MMRNALTTLFLIFPLVAGAQVLENPGFESGTEGWKISEKEPVSSVVEEAAHEGKLGLHVGDESQTTGANVGSQKVPVSAGQKVSLGFWARTGMDSLLAVIIIPYSENNKPITDENGKFPNAVFIKKKSGDWERYEYEFQVPDGVAAISLSIRSWTSPVGSADLDDFELKIE